MMPAIPQPAQEIYEFGLFRLDVTGHNLRRDGEPIPLPPKVFDTLLVLVRNSGRLLEKERLLHEIWPDTFVEENNLARNVSFLRRVLGGTDEEFIETVPKLGYRFIAPVRRVQVMDESTELVLEKTTRALIVAEEEMDEMPAPAAAPAPRTFPRTAFAALLTSAGIFVLAGVFLAANVAGVRDRFWPGAPPRVALFASYATGVQMPSFSPDGERIAFAHWPTPGNDSWDIYVKTMGSDPPLRLTSGPAGDTCPTWSPDGSQIAFLRNTKDGSTSIYLVGALGGVERKLLDLTPNRYFDLDWSPDGQYIAFAEKTDPRLPWDNFRSLGIFLLSVETLKKRQITFPSQSAGDNRFAFSPDGSTLAFVRYDEINGAYLNSIWRVPVEGGDAAKIHEERSWIGDLAWTGEGASLVIASVRQGGSKLFRISATGGAPEPLPFGEESVHYPAISRRGDRLAYVREYSDADLWRVELKSFRGPGKTPVTFLATARDESDPEFSPDGSRLAFWSEGTGKREVWMSNADGTNPIALTDFGAGAGYAPSWSPDGKELAFVAGYGPGKTQGGTFVLRLETRQVRRLTGEGFSFPSWSRDGQWIYLTFSPQRLSYQIWKIPSKGGSPVQVQPGDGVFAQESADGQTLFYTKEAGGIWSRPVTGGEEIATIPTFPGHPTRICWRVAVGGIYYLNEDAKRGAGFEFFDLAARRSYRLTSVTGYDPLRGCSLTVSPDRKWIVFSQPSRSAQDIMLVENFR